MAYEQPLIHLAFKLTSESATTCALFLIGLTTDPQTDRILWNSRGERVVSVQPLARSICSHRGS